MHFDLKKFEQAVLFAAPLILPAFGVPTAAVNLVVHGVLVAEHAGNGMPKTGDEKKTLALEAVMVGADAVNAAKPGTLDVPALVNAADGGIDAVIQAVNSAHSIPVHGK